jgi:uncharacterized SAM-binding protein YcdF (DUF218 family)
MVHGGLLFLLWMLLRYRGKMLPARIVGGLFLGWIGLIFLTSFPAYLVCQIEKKYQPLDVTTLDPGQSYHIMVLGSGKVSDPALPPTSQLDAVVMMRMVEGIRLYRQLPASQLVTSASAVNSATPQARTVADAAVSLGVSPSDTIQLTLPTTTRTEAFAYKARLGADQKPLILVTSALHMPRAVRWFHHAGIEVIPAPCDFRIRKDPAAGIDWPPYFHGMALYASWLHEVAGLVQYAYVDRFKVPTKLPG